MVVVVVVVLCSCGWDEVIMNGKEKYLYHSDPRLFCASCFRAFSLSLCVSFF